MCCMLYKTGFVSISPTVAEWQAMQKCVTDRHKIFPLTAIAPILNGGWGQKPSSDNCPLELFQRKQGGNSLSTHQNACLALPDYQ